MTFEEIYRAYAGRILNLIHRMTGVEDVARDLTQDVFLKVHDNLPSFRHESEVYTWVHRIAVNHVLNHLKREKRLRPLVAVNDFVGRVVQRNSGERGGPEPSTGEGAAEAVERAEMATIVREALESLHPRYRVPLILFHYENMSYREIAGMMDLSVSAVESRIHRAKKRLVELLGPIAGQL